MGSKFMNSVEKKQGKNPLPWRGAKYQQCWDPPWITPLAIRLSAQQPPLPQPSRSSLRSTLSDKVKPQHLRFPKVSLPLFTKA